MKTKAIEALQNQKFANARRVMFKAVPGSIGHVDAVIAFDKVCVGIRLQRLVNATMTKDIG